MLDVEFRHSTRKKINLKFKCGERSILTLGSLCLLCYMRNTDKAKNI